MAHQDIVNNLPSSSALSPAHLLHSGYHHPLLREWQSDIQLTPSDLVYPIFVTDQTNKKSEISSLPGQYRWSVDLLPELLDELVPLGLRSVILFGVLEDEKNKSEGGDFSFSASSPVIKSIALIKEKYPSIYIMCDICLCAYTHSGHCGILDKQNDIDNQASLNVLTKMAVMCALTGAHCVAPSDMMDGRIGAIKEGLRDPSVGLSRRVAVCSYAAKFSSCFYGPFRDAAGSGAKFGDRSGYQLPPLSKGLAKRAVARDVEEGADIIMCKPAMPYLDIVKEMASNPESAALPIAVYHVSGEYAMLYHAAKAGAFKLEEAVLETFGSFKRAGARIIITYFTPFVLKLWAQQRKQ